MIDAVVDSVMIPNGGDYMMNIAAQRDILAKEDVKVSYCVNSHFNIFL